MKTLNRILFGAALIVAPFIASAADTYNINSVINPIVNTATLTNDVVGTNTITAGSTKGASGVWWTNSVSAPYTNMTLLTSTGTLTKDTALQFTANLVATNASAVTVVWTLARSVTGGTITNTTGSPAFYELFAQVTNTVPVNSTAAAPVVLNISSMPTTPANVGVLTSFSDGAIPFIYVYSVTTSAGVATNLTVSSYSL